MLTIIVWLKSSLRATKGIVAWIDFLSLREELRSNSTKQSSKKFCISEFF
ncbi:MAG TPA: hypothetical protein LFV92_07150 [Rickettsia endosymbiont of Ceroptres masudai]|nr:hypothetical protein [Rickettsia endosymbiont of Ceroptres masudai]